MFSSQALNKAFTKNLVLLVATLTSFASPAGAASLNECSPEMSQQAEVLLPAASLDWSSLHSHQKTFHSCDDGVLAEGYSEAVTHLFAKKWNQLSKFSTLAKKNANFKRWAFRHIDASASSIDLAEILANTDTCLKSALTQSLCEEIRHATANALSEAQK